MCCLLMPLTKPPRAKARALGDCITPLTCLTLAQTMLILILIQNHGPLSVKTLYLALSLCESDRRSVCPEGKLQGGVELPSAHHVLKWNQYVQILELYRARWQIEQVFYRLKSLFGYNNVPSKRDDTVKAWFYGKLMLAALCERILKDVPFPPALDAKIIDIITAQFVG